MRGRAAMAAALLGLGSLAAAGDGPEGRDPAIRGMIRAEAQLLLPARTGGVVTAVKRVEGDPVQPGEPVVLIDDAEQQGALALARCDLETAELNLAKIRSGPRPEDLARGRALYEEGKAGLELAERTLKSDLELHQGGILSDLGRLRSERSVDAARANAESRRLDLVILEKGPRPEDVRLAEVALERERARVAQREREVAVARVAGTRPGRAFVSRVWVEEGQWVEAGRAVAELVYMDRLRIEIDLPEKRGLALARGTRAVVRSPGHPGARLEARVDRVAPVVDVASGTVRVVVIAENPELVLRPGMEAEVEILP